MLNSIIQRHKKLIPLTETEIKIIAAATRLFLEQGYSATTHRQISKESGLGLGTVTYHYRAKEDMLKILIEELMDYHLDIIEESAEKAGDSMFACALEVAVQIALCENNAKARDLYYAAYSHPTTFEFIKNWASEKNYHLLKESLPHLTTDDFRKLENVSSGIELAAFSTPCDRYFSLDDKIALFLEAIMKIYDIPTERRKQIVEKVLALDCEKIAVEMFDKFVKKLN